MAGEMPAAGSVGPRHIVAIPQPWASLAIGGHQKILTNAFGFEYRGVVSVYADSLAAVLPDGLRARCAAVGMVPEELPHGCLIGTIVIDEIVPASMVNLLNPADYGWVLQGQYVWRINSPRIFDVIEPMRRVSRFWIVEPARKLEVRG